MKRAYAFVGSWSLKPADMGLSIYSYDPETAEMEWIKTIHPEMAVGNQYMDRERGILYITDESEKCRDGSLCGYVQAFALGGENIITDLNGKATLLPKPSYFCLDHTKKYALAAHHSNRGQVTKFVQDEDGTFRSEMVVDDAGLALFTVKEDGSIGKMVDMVLTPGGEFSGPHARSHQHCVNEDPTGRLFLVCDKGMDRIYSFHLDRENGKLDLINTTTVETGYAPRYAAFHPTLPVVYINNERQPVLHVFHYDAVSGALELQESICMTEDASEHFLGADIVMHPNGKVLYTSARGANAIVVFSIDENGMLEKKQSISCGGENPRGLCLAPDGRFLLCANIGTDSIVRFRVDENGMLHPSGGATPAHIPGNITIGLIEN